MAYFTNIYWHISTNCHLLFECGLWRSVCYVWNGTCYICFWEGNAM